MPLRLLFLSYLIYSCCVYAEEPSSKITVKPQSMKPKAEKLKAPPWGEKCSVKHMRIKDCHLKSKDRKIHVWNDKIFLTTAIAHDLKPVAIDAAAEWEFVRLDRILDRDLLEVALWSQPQGGGDVSILVWTIYEFDDRSLTQKASAIIQRRKQNTTSLKYNYDKRFHFGLMALDKKVHWYADKEKGSF